MNFYLFIVQRSPATNESVFDCIHGAMGRIQLEDPSAFCFVRDLTVTIVIAWDLIALLLMALMPWILPL